MLPEVRNHCSDNCGRARGTQGHPVGWGRDTVMGHRNVYLLSLSAEGGLRAGSPGFQGHTRQGHHTLPFLRPAPWVPNCCLSGGRNVTELCALVKRLTPAAKGAAQRRPYQASGPGIPSTWQRGRAQVVQGSGKEAQQRLRGERCSPRTRVPIFRKHVCAAKRNRLCLTQGVDIALGKEASPPNADLCFLRPRGKLGCGASCGIRGGSGGQNMCPQGPRGTEGHERAGCAWAPCEGQMSRRTSQRCMKPSFFCHVGVSFFFPSESRMAVFVGKVLSPHIFLTSNFVFSVMEKKSLNPFECFRI